MCFALPTQRFVLVGLKSWPQWIFWKKSSVESQQLRWERFYASIEKLQSSSWNITSQLLSQHGWEVLKYLQVNNKKEKPLRWIDIVVRRFPRSRMNSESQLLNRNEPNFYSVNFWPCRTSLQILSNHESGPKSSLRKALHLLCMHFFILVFLAHITS